MTIRGWKTWISNERGKVLLVVLAMSILIQLFGGYLLTQSAFIENHVPMETLRIQSEYVTEAGLQWAFAQLYMNRDITGKFVIPVNEIVGEVADFIDPRHRFLDEDVFEVEYVPLDAGLVEITVVTRWSSNEVGESVQHGIEAIIDKETFCVTKRE